MNRLNSIALLAGSALVAVAASGCASNAAKPAASGPAAGSSSTAGAPSTAAPSAPGAASSSAPGAASSSAPAGGASTAPVANGSSSPAAANGGTTDAAPPAAGHPVCDNAKLNASLAPRIAGQAASIAVIAVENAGPTCTVGPIPYLWIVTSPTDVSKETRPLIPNVDTGKKNIILSGTTVYAAIDLNPGSAPDAPGGYGYLEVTPNPTKDSSGKDVQDVQLFEPTKVAGAKLSVWANNPGLAISQIQYATTPEQ